MRSDGVVVSAPALDNDLSLSERVEDLAIEQFIAQASIEAFDEAVLPGTARCNIGGPCADGSDPFLHGFGDELGAVVGADVPGHAAQNEQVRERVDDVDGFEPAGHTNGQAFMGELVDNVEHADPAPVVGAVLDEVVGPDMIAVLGSEPDAGAVSQPEATTLRLPGGNLQPLASPDPLDPLDVEEPSGPAQQLGDLAIAIAAILAGQLDDVGRQKLFVFAALRDLTLRRAMLAERRTGATLGDG
jgi:hypothetical protein